MSDDIVMDKVIERIQKLLSKTKSGAGTSEAEAETAMRLAQDLMMKHNLDMAVIEAAADKGATTVERVKEASKSRVRFKWQRTLAKYVAEAHFCYHLIKAESVFVESRRVPCEKEGDHEDHRDQYGYAWCQQHNQETGAHDDSAPWTHYTDGRWTVVNQHIFVGRKSNVITAQLMFEYLTQAIENAVPVENTQQRFSRKSSSWKAGCADRLCERLAQRREDLIKQNDARAKAEDEARKAEAQAAHDAKMQGKAKELPANEGAEVDAKIGDLKKKSRVGFGNDIDPNPDRPKVREGDTWNPADAEEQPQEESGTSLVLASVYDESEREANYEAAHDLPPGYFARQRAKTAEFERQEAEEEAKAQVDQIDAPVREETERQRKARINRQEKEREQNRRRWAREDEAEQRRERKEHNKRDHEAYYAGADAGKKIGLDMQVGARKDQKRLGK